MTETEKNSLKRELVECLRNEQEIRKIIVFGSFLERDNPGDLDVAVFQDSCEGYLPLALRYRKRIRSVSRCIPVDVFPVRMDRTGGGIIEDIERGEVLYER